MPKQWIDDDGTLTMGKHMGKKIETVARDDEDYLQWIMNLDDTSVKDRRVIAASMKYLR